ncbi:MAG: DUF488 family protein [Candidatus Methanoperedens sp.]|nr:DUF488 family protein [Candidatus Methanoperedens sp.]MCZ7406215.1 DUF488 family protein [Candidatus Methanoperedens sp.]
MRTLTHKQRVLLNVVERLAEKGSSSKFMLVKTLFLLAIEENMGRLIKFYNFFPYRFGPFSNVCYTDLSILEREGYLLENEKHLALTAKGEEAIKRTNLPISLKIKRVTSKFNSDRDIREYVYKNYTDYTIKSEIIPHAKTENTSTGIFTIGYEGKDIDSFLNTLIKNEIDLLIDVRKNPFSMNFSFTKGKLNNYLEKTGIEYLHIPELGIDGELRENLFTIKDYHNLFKQYEATTLVQQHEHVLRIIKLSEKRRVVLMCFEENKNMCHRGIIANSIEKQYGVVTHI